MLDLFAVGILAELRIVLSHSIFLQYYNGEWSCEEGLGGSGGQKA